MRRKHRRKYPANASCRCPTGSTRVTTCTVVDGKTICRGRGWGCIGGAVTRKGRATMRFIPMMCEGGSWPVKEEKKRRARARRMQQTEIVFEEPPFRSSAILVPSL